jgi:biotin transport system substrate-specific component
MMKDKGWFIALLGTAILCLVGPLNINMPGYVPITLQSLGVILVPMIFGWRAGVLSIALYLLLGAFGVPVFADFKGGADIFAGPTAGFLFGFLPAGFVAGWYAQKVVVQYGRFFVIFIGAHVILLVCGVLGLLIYGQSFSEIWNTVVFLFPGMMIKSFFGAFLALAVKMKKDPVKSA